ncbi:MAG TPA: aminotransferase class I and II, partial [Thermoanaerobaculia bacterium]|nr:aminotransferase class I and II [Thermoanaerobaculia bacterium]
NWQNLEPMAGSRFPAIRDHVLLPWASRIEEADLRLRPQLGEELFARVIADIPESWLQTDPGLSPADRRAGYLTFLTRRLEGSAAFVEEAVRARAQLV